MIGYPPLNETSRQARQRLKIAEKGAKRTHKRVTMPRRMKARQPRLAIPRSVNMEPESLSISRRGSGRWRSSSGSGLSILQFEGSADNENCERRKEGNGRPSAWMVDGSACEECAVPCRPATWLTHRTVSRPGVEKWGKYHC